MKLYKESKKLIFQAQHRDPFFHYLTSKLIGYMDKRGSIRVIDLGCGSGRNVIAAARMGYDCLGVDISRKAIEIGWEKTKQENLNGKVSFIRSDLYRLKPKQMGHFDYCIMSEVIEHLEDYRKGLRVAYSLLKKGGMLLLTTPHDPGQWNVLDDYAEHVRRFTIDQIKESLASFDQAKIFTVGFPFHRVIIGLYHNLCRLQRKGHQPKTFRDGSLSSKLYYLIGSLVLRFDDNLNFIHKGTTIVAVAEK